MVSSVCPYISLYAFIGVIQRLLFLYTTICFYQKMDNSSESIIMKSNKKVCIFKKTLVIKQMLLGFLNILILDLEFIFALGLKTAWLECIGNDYSKIVTIYIFTDKKKD